LSRVFFDTNLFIYLLDGSGSKAAQVNELLERMSARRDELLTSSLTLGEVLVKPIEQGDTMLMNRYEQALNDPAVVLVPFERDAARIYARIRQDKTVKAPDAIQLSCAAAARCDLFVTNDDRLSRQIVPGIQFITSLDRVPV
jgi:uncharacterized protein